jgi:ATP-binding cassette, subfamily B (MDR/TAP), member 1
MKTVGMCKIMSHYSPTWLAYFSFVVTIINGFGFPLYGLIFSQILFVMLNPFSTSFNDDRNFWCGMFLLLAGGVALFGFLNKYQFTYLGENLTFTIRKKVFTGIIYKHLAWFDNKDRAPGILSNVLSEDITLLNGMTTEVIAIILESFLALVIGFILSMVFNWKIGLVLLRSSCLVVL